MYNFDVGKNILVLRQRKIIMFEESIELAMRLHLLYLVCCKLNLIFGRMIELPMCLVMNLL